MENTELFLHLSRLALLIAKNEDIEALRLINSLMEKLNIAINKEVSHGKL